MDAPRQQQRREGEGGPLTVVLGGWTVVLEEQPQATAEGGDDATATATTLKVSVRTASGRPLPAAQVRTTSLSPLSP
jgi:hypothetical protein